MNMMIGSSGFTFSRCFKFNSKKLQIENIYHDLLLFIIHKPRDSKVWRKLMLIQSAKNENLLKVIHKNVLCYSNLGKNKSWTVSIGDLDCDKTISFYYYLVDLEIIRIQFLNIYIFYQN